MGIEVHLPDNGNNLHQMCFSFVTLINSKTTWGGRICGNGNCPTAILPGPLNHLAKNRGTKFVSLFLFEAIIMV